MSRARVRAGAGPPSLPSDMKLIESIPRLLELGGVSRSNKEAAAWLREAIEGARGSYRAGKNRPLATDHNDLLADIEKSAKELIKRIERLRQHPVTWHAFWHCSVFGPVFNNRVEVPEVLATLGKIVSAADAAKDRRKGRRREVGKQHVVDLAFGFFVRFSPHTSSRTATGLFAEFARAFYAAVTSTQPGERGDLDRQIRQAAKRLPMERERAQRKSR
jgi:hypothetical protein